MKAVILSRSDTEGGAAVVSRRLAVALRNAGHMVTMVTASSFPLYGKLLFVADRLSILLSLIGKALPFTRRKRDKVTRNLWKIDTGKYGLPVWKTPDVKEADTVIIAWANQGMLSNEGIRKLAREGKKLIWVMHDMWAFTGICHHALGCTNFERSCGNCPLLGHESSPHDLSHKIWERKKSVYKEADITFVAVSNWLAEEARKSSLLRDAKVVVIPNPFPASHFKTDVNSRNRNKGTKRILFAAAILDNWIKGLDTFREAIRIVSERYKGKERLEVVMMGGLKDTAAIEGFALPVDYKGIVEGDGNLAEVYSSCDVVVNCSLYETLPGTLIEGQASGAVPVAFDRGGQRDIIDHLSTGYLASYSQSKDARAEAIAEGILWALDAPAEVKERMRGDVERKFSEETVACSFQRLEIND